MVVQRQKKAAKKDLRTEAHFTGAFARQMRIQQPCRVSFLTQKQGCFFVFSDYATPLCCAG
nr:MAG TPA: hypothetical protein [Caudoviricetes sp.]